MPSNTTTNIRAGVLAFEPFSRDELRLLRGLARRPGSFDALAHSVFRIQVLRTLRGGPLDAEADLGAKRAEEAALAALAVIPAPDPAGLRLKADLFASRYGADDNLATMLAASIQADASRLRARAAASATVPRATRRVPAGELRAGQTRPVAGQPGRGLT